MDPEETLDPADLGTDPNPAPAGDPAAPEITETMRNQILSEAVARGDVVPAWMLQGDPGQPPTREAPPAGNVRPTLEDCDFDPGVFADRLTAYYEKETREQNAATEAKLIAMFGPAIAEGRTAAMVASVSGIAPAARPYLEQMIKAAGAEAANWTPNQRLIVENAAIGQALRDGKLIAPGRNGYQPEPTGGVRVPDVQYGTDPSTGETYGKGHEDAMTELFQYGIGRTPTAEDFKSAGVRR